MNDLKHADQSEPAFLLGIVLDDVLSDRRVFLQKNVSVIELAEYVLALISEGERDVDRLRISLLTKLGFDRLEAADP